MKTKVEKTTTENVIPGSDKKITRKQALRKSGYIALSAATALILLGSPAKAGTASPAPPPPW